MINQDSCSWQAETGVTPSPLATGLHISQAEISRLRELRLLTRELDNEAKQLRLSIRDRLDKGAIVDCGQYQVTIREVSLRRLNAQTLAAWWGPEYVEQLKAAVKPTIYRQLVIEEAAEQDSMDALLGAEG